MAIWRSAGSETGAHQTGVAVAAPPHTDAVSGAASLVELHPPDVPRSWLFPGSDELYRSIYTAVSLESPEVLAVTSAIAGEGKTTTALGLAVIAAQDSPDRRVLLVEADLDQPVLAGDFEVDPSPGLADCLLSDELVHNAYRTTFLHNLHLVPAGSTGITHGRLIRSSWMPHLLESMKRSYDLIIVDGPAILANSDAVRLSDLANGTVFVIRSGVTPSALVRQGLERLDEAKIRGVVLNGQTSSVPPWLRRLLGF